MKASVPLIWKHQGSKISDWMKGVRTKLRKRVFWGSFQRLSIAFWEVFQQLQSDGLVCPLLCTHYCTHATPHTILRTHTVSSTNIYCCQGLLILYLVRSFWVSRTKTHIKWLEKDLKGGWRDDSAVKSTGCSSIGPRFYSQHPHSSS